MSTRIRDQQGFAVPVVIFLLLGMMSILAVGAVAAMNTQQGTVRDTNTKSALAVAESGVDTALLRYARAEPSAAEPCVDGNGETYALAEGVLWCDPVAGDVDGSTFTYYTRPDGTEGESGYEYDVEVVAIGDVDGVNRVVRLDGIPLFAVDPEPVYLTESLVADQHMELAPGAEINGSIGSNGTIEVGNSTQVCGSVRYGPGSGTDHQDMWDVQENCPEHEPEEPIEKSFKLERIDLPEGENWAQNNSHFEGLHEDLAWDPEARTLKTTKNNVNFTITEPGPYLLCRMDITGQSIMTIAAGVEAIFYFDDPANCPDLEKEPIPQTEGLDDAYLQMAFTRGNVAIGENEPYPIFYFLGSETDETFIDINTNSGHGWFHGVIYAPDTHIVNSMGGFRFRGAMVGRSVWIRPGSETQEDVEIFGTEFQIGVNEAIYTVFMKEGFRECPVSAASSESPYDHC